MNFRKFFLNYLWLLLLNLLMISATLADFGGSCVALPNINGDSYLFANSAYGHIISNIDMTSYITGACDANSANFSFCLKDAPGSNPICQQISLKLGDAKTLNSLSTNPDLGGNAMLQNIVLTVANLGNNICLMMPTSRGPQPLACRANNTTQSPVTNPVPACSNISDICYGGSTKSQSILNFTGDTINCLTQTLNLVFYQQNVCASDPATSVANTILSPFPAFQESLKAAVRGALIIYVIFFGFKIVLNSEYADLNNIASFVMKFLLVAYFAVGLGPAFFNSQGTQETKNGVTEFMLPFLSGATANFAEMIFQAGGAHGLCSFDVSRYQAGYEGYAIWDAIDCRVGYYLGMQLLYNNSDILKNLTSSTPNNNSSNNDAVNIASTNDGLNSLKLVGGMPFFSVMFGFLMGGNIIIVIAGIMFMIVFVSVLLQFISTYLVCLVTIYVMAYISPIFVTMALFKNTKAYFDSWLKIIISCSLQPAMLAGFIAVLLTTYDTAIFGGCQFQRHDYTIGDNNFSTFELRVPSQDSNSCTDSAGYKLLQYYSGQGWTSRNFLLFPIYYIIDVFLLMTNLIYVAVFTFIFYFFSKSVSQFASDLTGGPGMSAVTASPTKVIDQAKKFAAMAAGSGSGGGITSLGKQALKGADELGSKKEGGEGGEGGGEAKDSIASGDVGDEGAGGMGGDGAKDMIGK